jgi:hypothetical protein
MQQNGIKKLTYADIGYRGKPIDTLTREELLEAYLELVQKVYELAETEDICRDVFTVAGD